MNLRITKKYSEKVLFQDLALEIEENKILCLLGASGVGKTTLLNILAGLNDYEGGIEPKIDKVAYIFQTPRLLPHLTAEENLRYAAEDAVTKERIEYILQKLEIDECKARKARLLSGGEQRRVAIARAFLSSAPILLMDEPFASLDTALKIRLINVFAQLWSEQKKTTIFVTHDVEEALMLGDRIITLGKRGIVGDFLVKRTKFPSEYGTENELRTRLLNSMLQSERE